jgi:uncharacterized protein with PIN domain
MKRLVRAENINESLEKDDLSAYIEAAMKQMNSMEVLNELSEADVKHDRCPVCNYKQLQKYNGFKICPQCFNIFKTLDGKAYVVYY